VSILKFNGAWRFHPPASIDHRVVNEFSELIGKIAAQGDLQPILEHFKKLLRGGLRYNFEPEFQRELGRNRPACLYERRC